MLTTQLRLTALLVLLALFTISAPPDGVTPSFERARAKDSGLRVGIHAPNREWREQDFVLVGIGEFDGVKMMSYHQPEVYRRLRRYAPSMEFVVRLNTNWHELPTPEQFVAEHAAYLRSLVNAGIVPWVEIANEPNLELHPHAEAAFASWYLDTLRLLRNRIPQAKYGFPGLAKDLREFEWLEANAEGIRQSDWLGVHAYWTDEREMLDPNRALKLVEVHRRFPSMPLIVTEAGNTAHEVSGAEKGKQYARFTRTLARLPYVRGVYYFILYGTREWSRFFFDDGMAIAVREAGREPIPPLARLLGARPPAPRPWISESDGTAPPVQAGPLPTPTAVKPIEPTPTPEGLYRRRLLADVDPVTAAQATNEAARPWLTLPPAPAPAAGLRTARAFTVTDASVRLSVMLPQPGEPLAIQFADSDLFTSPAATGVVLLWDGVQWRLQYRKQSALEADLPLAHSPTLPFVPPVDSLDTPLHSNHWEADHYSDSGTGQQTPSGDDWLEIEIALEPRSAAAWIWRRGGARPEQPNAVFAPPKEAALDGAQLRAIFLPAHQVANVIMEGGTRYW